MREASSWTSGFPVTPAGVFGPAPVRFSTGTGGSATAVPSPMSSRWPVDRRQVPKRTCERCGREGAALPLQDEGRNRMPDKGKSGPKGKGGTKPPASKKDKGKKR